jgi:hypothetical protein
LLAVLPELELRLPPLLLKLELCDGLLELRLLELKLWLPPELELRDDEDE